MSAATMADDDNAEAERFAEMTTTTSMDVDAGPREDDTDPMNESRRQYNWHRIVTYGLLPALALILFVGAGYLKWTDSTIRDSQMSRAQSVQAARDATVTLLSYTPADVEQQLTAARDLTTGEFRNSYTDLTTKVVIPGAKEQQIKAVASVPAATAVSATADHAVAMVFVDQTTTVGAGAPTTLASTIRVGLDKVDGQWLISQFDPI